MHLPTPLNIQSLSSTKNYGKHVQDRVPADRDDAASDVLRPLLRRPEWNVPGAGHRRRHELLLVLLLRQDRAGRLSRSAGNARRTAARLRSSRGGFTALFLLLAAPIAASLIRPAVPRPGEYQADATGAHFTGNPSALASALQKPDAYSHRVPMQATPSTAHLFIIQPFLGMNFGSLFSTHPPIAKRIERLTGRPAELRQ